MTPADTHVKRLQNNCSVTLERYMDLAQATCKVLTRLRNLPLTKDRRLELFLQRKREDEAHAAYMKARDGLLHALAVHEDLPDLEPKPRGLGPRSSRSPRVQSTRRHGFGA